MNNESETDQIAERKIERDREIESMLTSRKVSESLQWLSVVAPAVRNDTVTCVCECVLWRVCFFHLEEERPLGSAGIKSRSSSLRLASLPANTAIHTLLQHMCPR